MPVVDISKKPTVRREAIAEGYIKLRRETVDAIRRGGVKKGDPLETAKVAASLAVKNTPSIIPYCHPIPIENVKLEFKIMDDGVLVRCHVKATAKTGVEMEALTGVSVALLTIWDMVKYLEKDETGQYPFTEIKSIKVISKVKGDGTQRT
ncbi:MAG: cyclic pyranopterin monophosphate synthase MoaC [Euryarchaeota archaeon]|nr:cyclic pyranopterin monophosphate synthase MoaC [Euryarchaeota archaeon]MCD6158950.1 cyclic pyranopterin monophosphate synthase MoaC [Euryarchaeota archaeon]